MACSCSNGKGNTGFPSCLPTNEIPVGLLFQSTYDSTGTRNFLSGATIGTVDYLNGLTQNGDTSKRLYPVQDIAEGVSERGDTSFYTDSLGVNHFLKEGERGFIGEKVTDANPKLVGKVDSYKCNQMSVYIIGHLGGIFGVSNTAGQLEGFEIVKNTMDVKWVWMTPAKPAHMPISFTLADTVLDEEISKFEKAQIADTAKSLSGLTDVDGTVDGTITVSAFTVDLVSEYGTVSDLTEIEGLVSADFLLTEISPTPGVTTITSVNESSAGKYVFTVTTTSADVNHLTLSANGIAKGYEMTAVVITTP